MNMFNMVHLGLGPLGQKVVRFAIERGCFSIVTAVDPDPAKTGKDLGELCGIKPLGIKVSPTLKDAMNGKKAQIAVVTTVSSLAKFEPQALELAQAGLHIVSTCEELAFPWRTQPQISERIDAMCKKHGIACVGTGVNPGFLMEYLPSVLTGVCQKVDSIHVWRIQDASVRRVPFQQKIGAGLTLDEFRKKEEEGTLRHVGLPESVDFIAAKMGWKLDRSTESLEPVMADTDVKIGYKPIIKGMARGVYQVGRGFVGSREVIKLEFRAAVGEPQSYDRIVINGDPKIDSTITGGVNGDIATCAITLNAIRSILSSTPGLKTMCDIPTVTFYS
jgi:4-hydroxy-tetrahydrodipicolinate reductase